MTIKQTYEEIEYLKTRNQLRIVGSTAAIVMLSGALVYHQLMHLNWIDAFYFTTITLATVGYGDIAPNTPAAKIFTIFYVLIGIGIVATFASLLIKNAGAKRAYRQVQRKNK